MLSRSAANAQSLASAVAELQKLLGTRVTTSPERYQFKEFKETLL